MNNDKLLGVYLNDHLAGATAGVELARKLGEKGEPLRSLAEEIDEDRVTLMEIMARLEIPVRRYKAWLGWVAEKVSRLKRGGDVLPRIPVSDVLELEMMRLGVEGKAAGWRTLRARAAHDPRLDEDRLSELVDRADRQITQLEELRVAAATRAFT